MFSIKWHIVCPWIELSIGPAQISLRDLMKNKGDSANYEHKNSVATIKRLNYEQKSMGGQF